LQPEGDPGSWQAAVSNKTPSTTTTFDAIRCDGTLGNAIE